MTMWTVVIPRELPSAAAGRPCLDRDFLSMSLPLSLPATEQASKRGRQEAEECLLQLSGWNTSSHPPTPHTSRASPFLPTRLRPCPLTAPANSRTSSVQHSSQLEQSGLSDGAKTALTVTPSECWFSKVFPQFHALLNLLFHYFYCSLPANSVQTENTIWSLFICYRTKLQAKVAAVTEVALSLSLQSSRSTPSPQETRALHLPSASSSKLIYSAIQTLLPSSLLTHLTSCPQPTSPHPSPACFKPRSHFPSLITT